MTEPRPRFEVAEILREHGEAFLSRYPVTPVQRKAIRAMVACRTAALGGHLDRCTHCDYTQPSYNSCRHRACPKCQGQRQREWIAKQAERALPVPYFHVVFTLPAALRPLAAANPKVVYALLLNTAARTVVELGKDPRLLGAEVGVTAVLHTWTTSLHLHPHVHLIVTAGGLAQDATRWVPSRWGACYLLPVKALGRRFRARFLRRLERAERDGKLQSTDVPLANLKPALYAKDWVVYAKRPFAGVRQLYRYLGRYTHRVGLTNHRLLAVTPESIALRTRNGTARFAPLEFLRRFLQHVPPKGFVRVRHFGIFASSNLRTKLARARELLSVEDEESKPSDREEPAETPDAMTDCPRCLFGQLRREELLLPTLAREEALWDP